MNLDLITNLQKYWEKRIAIVLLFLLTIGFYEFISLFECPYCIRFSAVFFVVVLLWWLIDTHRLILPTRKFLVEVYVNFSEDEAEKQMRQIIDDSIKSLNNQNKNLKVIRRPFNTADDVLQIGEKLKRRLFVQSKLIVVTHIIGGNITENGTVTYKAEVDKFNLIGDFYMGNSIQLHKIKLQLKAALSICNLQYRDWKYIQCNSFNDNKKIKSNLEDTILFCVGLYDIFYRNFDEAIGILLKLYSTTNDKKETLSIILMNLIFDVAIRSYFNGDGEKAYKLLQKCDELFPQNQRLDRYIPLARIAYECNDLPKAKLYTEKLMQEKEGKFFGYINKGFFAIIEGDVSAMIENYTKVYNYSNSQKSENLVDVVDFLEQKKDYYLQYVPLFDFAEGFITRLFFDEPAGNKMLQEFINRYESNDSYNALIPLCQKAMSKKEYQHSYTKKQRKKVKRH